MELQKKDTTLPMVKVTKPSDLLKAKPMAVMVRDHGEEPVKKILFSALSKCAFQIGVELQDKHLATLAEDLLEVYQLDSIEDIVECLKKGRRGYYGTSYHKLNLIVINKWMKEHLDEKAEAREKHFKNEKEAEGGILFNEEYQRRVSKVLNQKKSEKMTGLLIRVDEAIDSKLDRKRLKFINEIMVFFKYYKETQQFKPPSDCEKILNEFREAGVIQGKITDEHEAIRQVFDQMIKSEIEISDIIRWQI